MTAPVLVARRTFLGNATLFCQYTVFGAARDGAGQPHVSGSWILKRANGTVVREVPARGLNPSADGRLLRLYGIALAGLSPGDYELTLAVRDELAVKAVELREPFTVERAVGGLPGPLAIIFFQPVGSLRGASARQPGIPGTAHLETFSCIFVIPFSGPISWTARTSTVPRGSGTNGEHPSN